jgi:hypothetical protein
MFWDGPSALQWKASREAAPSLGLDLAGIAFATWP